METKARKAHSRNCLSKGDWTDCEVCRTFNYGYFDAKSDIRDSRPRKWDNEGNLIAHLEKQGFSKKHYNPSYVRGYSLAYTDAKVNV